MRQFNKRHLSASEKLKCISGAIGGFFDGFFKWGLIGIIINIIALFIAAMFFPESSLGRFIREGHFLVICAALGAIIGAIVRFRQPLDAKKKILQEEEDRHKREQHRYKEEQEGYYKKMVDLGEKALSFFESMPKQLSYAETLLDQAEADFVEGAFAPFWDSIEKAANQLALFNQTIHTIKDSSSRYTVLVQSYSGAPPKFPLKPQSVEKMGVSTSTAERMKAIVRTAQRDFQFAMIYEQRKTNKILVEGFHSLAQALENMASYISASLDELGNSISTMTSTLDNSIGALHSELGDIAQMTSQQYKESSAREREALNMLDNIQRGRRT